MDEEIVNDDYLCDKHTAELFASLDPRKFVAVYEHADPVICKGCVKENKYLNVPVVGLYKITIS